MTVAAARSPRSQAWLLVRRSWESVSVYLPIILMGIMAMGTYWLARNTPMLGVPEPQRGVRHDPDYFMRHFSVKTFDANGRLKSEVFGTEARHFPDTDTIEIDQPKMRAFNARGEVTVATARTGITNSDGSEVQLIGDAVVTRDAVKDAAGHVRPRLEFRGEFLHAFLNTERVKSHKPVQLTRGNDQFTADSMDYDNVEQVLDLHGRVHGVILPQEQK